MREIRLYGSEGGGAGCSPYPYHSKTQLPCKPSTALCRLHNASVSERRVQRASMGVTSVTDRTHIPAELRLSFGCGLSMVRPVGRACCATRVEDPGADSWTLLRPGCHPSLSLPYGSRLGPMDNRANVAHQPG
jgi:hypothetical protein